MPKLLAMTDDDHRINTAKLLADESVQGLTHAGPTKTPNEAHTARAAGQQRRRAASSSKSSRTSGASGAPALAGGGGAGPLRPLPERDPAADARLRLYRPDDDQRAVGLHRALAGQPKNGCPNSDDASEHACWDKWVPLLAAYAFVCTFAVPLFSIVAVKHCSKRAREMGSGATSSAASSTRRTPLWRGPADDLERVHVTAALLRRGAVRRLWLAQRKRRRRRSPATATAPDSDPTSPRPRTEGTMMTVVVATFTLPHCTTTRARGAAARRAAAQRRGREPRRPDNHGGEDRGGQGNMLDQEAETRDEALRGGTSFVLGCLIFLSAVLHLLHLCCLPLLHVGPRALRPAAATSRPT